MNTTRITTADLASRKIASLPTRPTAPSAFGGKGYTAAQMKEAFDRLPLFLAEKLNSLIDDLSGTGEGSFVASLPTGLGEDHTLKTLFADIANGNFADYLKVGDGILADTVSDLSYQCGIFREILGNCYTDRAVVDIDCGSPAEHGSVASPFIDSGTPLNRLD